MATQNTERSNQKQSIWKQEQSLPSFPGLSGDTKTDVLIIGGGMAGILICYYLRQAGVDCLLAEKGRIAQQTN